MRLLPALLLVVASMVGTGVFTSLGFQVRDIPSGPVILGLWALGGLLALCGALCYAELAAAMPRSGGEYYFLSRLYHPSLGWCAGIISLVVGFAGPTALAALALGYYAHSAVEWLPPQTIALGALVVITAGHLLSLRSSARLQTAATLLKVILILAAVVAAFTTKGEGDIPWTFEPDRDLALVWQPAFALSLLFVFYAYSGWNATVYMADDIANARHTVARSLIGGTLVVITLYLLINAAFLKAAPLAALAGRVEVGHVAAQSLYGRDAARWFSGLLSLGLVATISALVWSGPRVLVAVGRDHPVFGMLTRHTASGVPLRATLLVSALAFILVVAGDFEDLLIYVQSGLTICAFLSVAGLFIVRRRRMSPPDAFRCPWFPLPPLVFLATSGFVLASLCVTQTIAALAGFGSFFVMWLSYFPVRYLTGKKSVP